MGKFNNIPMLLGWLFLSLPAKVLFLLLLLVVFLLSIPSIGARDAERAKEVAVTLPDISEFCDAIKDSDGDTYKKYCTK